MQKVIVGLSGGVDSSVAAYLLKEQGYEVETLFMINWHDTTGVLQGDCPWEEDVIIAELAARKLGIPFHTVDLSVPYRKRVVDYMFAEYKKGRTPNPDVLCNREIKFDLFVDEARKLGARKVATGHYSRIGTLQTDNRVIYRLLAGKDPGKDQSYFLCQLSQQQLAISLFPLGELLKSEVREIARKRDLPTAERKDSQGICFVGKVDLPTFLQQELEARDGDVIEIPASSSDFPVFAPGIPVESPDLITIKKMCSGYKFRPGTVIGHHRGAHFYTIGQRKGLNIGGKAKPLFVLHTDTKNNLLYVGQGHDHPGLNRKGLFIRKDELHWIREDLKMQSGEFRDLLVRIRYRQPLQKARLYMKDDGMYILFDQLQRGITPGQFAAWYDGEELLGSGVINA
ncbi:MAG: tRNA 2-thiouridine(34) synthase MnmA [Chlorobi bacterium]|nr:tRNA 2-thiouridine(34) synthase MnmA [Chlorobiota bacterium]